MVLVDSQSGFVIWVGAAAADVLKDVDQKTSKARLEHVMKQMFKKLPK